MVDDDDDNDDDDDVDDNSALYPNAAKPPTDPDDQLRSVLQLQRASIVVCSNDDFAHRRVVARCVCAM